jgi:hypothetical protein
MARPPTPDAWIAALRAEGITDIVEMPGWRTNNRNHKGPWGDVHSTMIHHTAGEGPGLPSLVFKGTASLPGPLCHDYLDRTGRLYLVGNGRANHAGTVARNAYNAVLNESATHPYPDSAEPVDGNAVSYGLEVENSGAVGRTWPARQYDVAVRVQAARCRMHGWSANSVWAHKEATRRKPVDPRLDMDAFRRDVAERLRHPAGWNPGSTAPTPTEEDDVALTTDDKKWIVATIRAEVGRAVAAWANEDIDPRDIFQIQRDAANYAKRAAEQTADLDLGGVTDEQTAAIAQAVATHPALAQALADTLAARLKD